jgi:carbonic anhydrase
MAETLWGAAPKWDAMEFLIHSPSEHTKNGKRYDMEIQIYHQAHINTEEEDGIGATATHRRMAASAPKANAHGDEESTRDENLFI